VGLPTAPKSRTLKRSGALAEAGVDRIVEHIIRAVTICVGMAVSFLGCYMCMFEGRGGDSFMDTVG